MNWAMAFDGIGSEVVGALVTVAVLVATLRFERRHTAHQRSQEEALRLRDEIPVIQAQLSRQEALYLQSVYSWVTRTNGFLRTLDGRPACFIALMGKIMERVATHGFGQSTGDRLEVNNRQTAVTMLQAAETVLRWYVFTPNRLKMSKAECDRTLAMIEQDYVFS